METRMVLHGLASERLKIDRPFDPLFIRVSFQRRASSRSRQPMKPLFGTGHLSSELLVKIYHVWSISRLVPFLLNRPIQKTRGSLSLLDNNSRGFTNFTPPWIIHEDSRIFNLSEGDQRLGERLLREKSRSNDRAQTPAKFFRSFVSCPRFRAEFSYQICLLYWLMEITVLSTRYLRISLEERQGKCKFRKRSTDETKYSAMTINLINALRAFFKFIFGKIFICILYYWKHSETVFTENATFFVWN